MSQHVAEQASRPGTGSASPALSEKKLDDVEYAGSGGVFTTTLSAGVGADGIHNYGDEGPSTLADDRETKRIMRKMDWHLLPILSVLYLFSFLDR